MGIPAKQIGWSNESNLLWQLAKQLEYLTKVTSTTSDVTVINDVTSPVPVIGPLTNEELRNSPIETTPIPSSNGTDGTIAYKLISTASTNKNIVKSSAGNLYSIVAIGLTSTVRYLKFFNTASGISLGEDIPVMTIPIPANTQGAGVVIPFPFGVNFSTGIAIGITAGSADNNEDPIDAGDVIVNLTYA